MDSKKAILAQLNISYMMVYAFNQEYNIILLFNVVMFYANGLYGFQYTQFNSTRVNIWESSLTLAIS